jgi:DNA repair protein RadC
MIKQFKLLTAVGEPVPEYAEQITKAEKAESFLREIWPDDMDLRETFIIVYLNRRNDILGYYVLSIGGVTSTVVDPRIVFGSALITPGCTGLILAHNHPSGNTFPSESDKDLTRQLRMGAEILELTIIDHLIMTNNSSLSFAEEGLL